MFLHQFACYSWTRFTAYQEGDIWQTAAQIQHPLILYSATLLWIFCVSKCYDTHSFKKKIGFLICYVEKFQSFLSLSRLSSSLLCWWIQERYIISPSISSTFKYFLLSWPRSCSHFTKRVPVGKSVSQRSTSNQFLNKIHRVYIFFILEPF